MDKLTFIVEIAKAVAWPLGATVTYIGAIERGERNVAIDNIAKIASALKIEMNELF